VRQFRAVTGEPAARSRTAGVSRPIFPYPDRAVYKGTGDWKDPGNYQRRPGSSRFP